MSAATALWTRIALVTSVSMVLLFAVAPARPSGRIAAGQAAAIGAAAGLALFVLAARTRPRLQASVRSAPALVARLAFFGLWATNEEILWRRFALGELLRLGVLPAIVATSVGFALTHRRRRALHLCTGGTFGALYVSTGVLAASVTAHWTYNALVGALVERDGPRAHGPPS